MPDKSVLSRFDGTVAQEKKEVLEFGVKVALMPTRQKRMCDLSHSQKGRACDVELLFWLKWSGILTVLATTTTVGGKGNHHNRQGIKAIVTTETVGKDKR